MSVHINQVFRDNDPRMAGRTLKVVKVEGRTAVMETVTNPDDIQQLLDEPEPGTRNYQPKDRRGKTTKISISRLEGTGFSEVNEPPEISGPVA